MRPVKDPRLVICGAGIAGIEALLRLRRLVGGRAQVTLLSPESEFTYRPLSVLEPFTPASVRRYPLDRIAADTDATWIRDRLVRVDPAAGKVHTVRRTRPVLRRAAACARGR